MPTERLGHHAHPHNVIVDLGKREVRIATTSLRGSSRKVDEHLLTVA